MRPQIPLLVALAIASSAAAGADRCVKAQEQAAEIEAGNLHSWDSIHRSFQKYSVCDDGSIAEGYDESVTLVLSSKWRSLADLETIARSDPRFLAFVLRHISGTVPESRLRRIETAARDDCEPTFHELCAAILQRVADAAMEAAHQ